MQLYSLLSSAIINILLLLLLAKHVHLQKSMLVYTLKIASYIEVRVIRSCDKNFMYGIHVIDSDP